MPRRVANERQVTSVCCDDVLHFAEAEGAICVHSGVGAAVPEKLLDELCSVAGALEVSGDAVAGTGAR